MPAQSRNPSSPGNLREAEDEGGVIDADLGHGPMVAVCGESRNTERTPRECCGSYIAQHEHSAPSIAGTARADLVCDDHVRSLRNPASLARLPNFGLWSRREFERTTRRCEPYAVRPGHVEAL